MPADDDPVSSWPKVLPPLAAASRPRPRLHFTASEGWINDPYGIAWVDGRYQLFYQALPNRLTWAPTCHWGHAESDDLIHWAQKPPALVPQHVEVGCWSGCVVYETEPPVIFYTRVLGGEWEVGRVARASFDRETGKWRTDAADVVLAAPELGLRSFRDPSVLRSTDGWTMLMGAALTNGTAAVLQYRSPDLHRWTYDGILCSRLARSGDEIFTGTMWECPQLLRMGNAWVLIVSVSDAHTPLYVAAAVGSYDGTTFQPRTWQRLTYGSSAYATTAFVDKDGRRCVMSWLREELPGVADFAGAHSIASTLTLDRDGVLLLQPHPKVDALRGPPLTGQSSRECVRHDVGACPVELSLTPSAGTSCDIVVDGSPAARLSHDPGRHAIVLHRPGFPAGELPVSEAERSVRLLLDADIIEIFAATAYGAYRIRPPVDPATTSVLLAGAGPGRVRQMITSHPLPRA